ncbi:stress response protein [Moesziomyces antarcticus]|uniref:Probable Rds1 protein n=1 Tax=Pseudozyma antarctica TaxID=84753 RepID=A0A5C3FH20_PSEA2|nr:stress response protein [Moesziomyces antarcticus]GAK62271.1 stress response protein [Moesziomyces antarcticus]SPO42811.1 probable Rds1 protein [Moesziomyces antarcticus]
MLTLTKLSTLLQIALGCASLLDVASAAPSMMSRKQGGPVTSAELGAGADPSKAGKNISSSYQPASSLAVKDPSYQVISDFDFQSIALALHQEYIELDLFNYGLVKFSDADYDAHGLDAEDRHLIRHMAQQEIGHAVALSNMLGAKAPKQCTYRYDFQTVPEFVDFCQRLTKWGESGVYGFLNLLDNRASAQILLQSITTEARQQYTFRQFEGLFPMPEWFETGLPQSWAWTLLSPWIVSCPEENQPLAWDIYPALKWLNEPDAIAAGKAAGGPSISNNVTALTHAGQENLFSWDEPGKIQGPYRQKTRTYTSGTPKFAAYVSQFNVSYTELYDVDMNARTAKARQPGGTVYPQGPSLVNSTVFVALTDTDTFYTPANLSLINKHVVAGPAIYQAG